MVGQLADEGLANLWPHMLDHPRAVNKRRGVRPLAATAELLCAQLPCPARLLLELLRRELAARLTPSMSHYVLLHVRPQGRTSYANCQQFVLVRCHEQLLPASS